MDESTKKSGLTLQYIAEAAGVSTSTVSRVLGGVTVKESEVYKNIQAIARSTGYLNKRRRVTAGPSIENVRRRSGKKLSGHLALLLPRFLMERATEDGIYHDIVSASQEWIEKHGFHMILSAYGDQHECQELPLLKNRSVDGIVWFSNVSDPEVVSGLNERIPVVVLNDCISWPPMSCVMPENRMLIFKAVEHLKNLGHNCVAYFQVDHESLPPFTKKIHLIERENAYLESIKYFDIVPEERLHSPFKFGMGEHDAAVAKAMDRFFADNQAHPTAVITGLSYAISFLREAQKRKISVPSDLSIVAIEDSATARLMIPALTTVSSRLDECARNAIDLLVQKLCEPHLPAKILHIEPELIVRESTIKIK